MRKLLLIILACHVFVGTSRTQNVYMTYNGIASFTSNAPLELITASSDQMHGALDLNDQSFIFTIENKTFKGFNSSLQQEHFYENYMEVQKYPNSTFKGRIIEAFDPSSTGEQTLRAKGILYIHGIEKERIIKGTLKRSGDKLILHAGFTVPLEDHNIRIPRVVYQKIAEVIDVSISAELTAKRN